MAAAWASFVARRVGGLVRRPWRASGGAVIVGNTRRASGAASLRADLGRVDSGNGNIIGIVASLVVGRCGRIGDASSASSARRPTPDSGTSPANVSQPVIDYGTDN